MKMGTVSCAVAVGGALLLLSPCTLAAEGSTELCPSATDVPYSVKIGDTLWTIAARSYCLNEWPPLYFAWANLYEHNRTEVGADPDHIYAGTVICLPERISRGKWHGDRCSESARQASTPAPSTCGNGRREGQEICDGDDLGGLSCEALGASPGRLACRSDCKGFETAGCPKLGGQAAPVAPGDGSSCPDASRRELEPSSQAKPTPEPRRPLVIRVAVEAVGGAVLPLTSELHDYIYRPMGMVGIGARVAIGAVEIAPRALFVYGRHGTTFNDVEQQQKVVGGGLQVQLGIPIEIRSFRLTPGVEASWLYLERTIELDQYPFAGQIETQSGHVPVAGIFLHPEYLLGAKKHFSVALDLSADMVLTRLGDNDVSTNFSAKLLGGVGYAF